MQDTDMKLAETNNEETSENVCPESEKTLVDERASRMPIEINGPKGPEPTRFGDWERKGRCVDF
jgi:hypothetical protein